MVSRNHNLNYWKVSLLAHMDSIFITHASTYTVKTKVHVTVTPFRVNTVAVTRKLKSVCVSNSLFVHIRNWRYHFQFEGILIARLNKHTASRYMVLPSLMEYSVWSDRC